MLAKRRCQGITLIELVVMISIVVILSALSIPSFVQLIKNRRISATAENLYYALQYARSEAVKRNTNVYFSFTTGDDWCYGINPTSACDCVTPSTCTLGSAKAARTQQISLSANGYTNSVIFESTHGAANASGSITLTLYGQSSLITIAIGRLGNLQICATGISGYTACE